MLLWLVVAVVVFISQHVLFALAVVLLMSYFIARFTLNTQAQGKLLFAARWLSIDSKGRCELSTNELLDRRLMDGQLLGSEPVDSKVEMAEHIHWQLQRQSRSSFIGCWLIFNATETDIIKRIFIPKLCLSAQSFSRLTRIINYQINTEHP